MLYSLVMTSKGEWVVGDTLDTDGLNDGEYYKSKYQQQLQVGRREWLEENQRPRKGDTADTEQTIQALIKNIKEKEQTIQEKENEKVRDAQIFRQQLEQKEREEAEKEQEIQRYHHLLQEKEREEAEKEQEIQRYCHLLQEKEREEAEKEQEIQRYCHLLQEKEREEAEKEQQFHHQLQEKERELQEKNEELQEKERELQEKEVELQNWVISKDEVILTREELGRGSYATVNVGTFRGLRVAVKSLHTKIVSDYNLALFSREMSIASRVRHPNLVQFIGATKVGNPLILIELMSTSLHAEIQKNQLTRQQILSIAQDVALGLNYLHLFKPQPIIHRDVSSPNVLLKPSTGPAGYEAKVADYGTAKLLQATSSGTVMPGNPAYAAPEAPIPDQHSPAMDVYSYSVLLMEITLRSPPEMTTVKRERQSRNVSWSPMKSLIQRGLNTTRQRRPTMSQVIESLRKIKV